MPSDRTLQSRSRIVDDALEVVDKRYAEADLSLNDVAQAIAVSRRQLQRSFESTGSPGFAYELSRMRVIKAAELLLADPHLTISAVVNRVGMKHRSNFASLFREHLGDNPKQWRAARQHASSAARR